MTQWSSSITDAFVAPGVINFRTANIADLSTEFPDAEHWVADHFLNSTLRGSYRGGMRQLAMGFLRRARSGFRAYHQARTQTLSYLAELKPGTQPLSRYFDAVDGWEQFALQVQMATDLYRHMPGVEDAFAKGDGSPEQRLYTIANLVKHSGRWGEGGIYHASGSLPLWLSNDAIHSFDVQVTFLEAEALLRDLARFAERLKDPITSVQEAVAERPER